MHGMIHVVGIFLFFEVRGFLSLGGLYMALGVILASDVAGFAVFAAKDRCLKHNSNTFKPQCSLLLSDISEEGSDI